MKKSSLICLLSTVLSLSVSQAQNLIAVQNGGNPLFFSQLDDALNGAQNGDTIYIPGGIFPISVSINKRLNIVGIGATADSTQATHYTFIYGGLTFESGSNDCVITGVKLNGAIQSGQNVNNVSVRRCAFNGLYLWSSCSGWILNENYISGRIYSSDSPGAYGFWFSNNIIDGYMGGTFYNDYPGFTNSTFRNNIYFSSSVCNYGCMYALKSPNSTIENNIFLGINYGSSLLSCDYSIINKNIFVSSWSPPANCFSSNNIINQPSDGIFIVNTYHLQPSCPGINAGADGTDIGIYGGTYPWKEGSIPFNPHIQQKIIQQTTDQNGNLNVNIKVAAQDN